jgi:hypothetical protein
MKKKHTQWLSAITSQNGSKIVLFELRYHDFRAAFDLLLQGAGGLYRIHLRENQELSKNYIRDDDVAAHNALFPRRKSSQTYFKHTITEKCSPHFSKKER